MSQETREGSLAPKGKLKYVPEFRKVVVQNPGLLRSFKALEQELEQQLSLKFGDVFEANGINITLINDAGGVAAEPDWDISKSRAPTLPGDYLKVEIGDNKFFVKRVKGHAHLELRGHDEIVSLSEARNEIKDIDNVEIVEFQLGYQDEKYTYLVSKWLDAVNLAEYLSDSSKRKEEIAIGFITTSDLFRSLAQKARHIRATLIDRGFIDVNTGNMLYDKKTGRIYLFDIHKKPQTDDN